MALAKRARVANPYTCPSCRAPVLGTKPNALVTSILEDYLRANPTRQKSEEERAQIAQTYIPGENILRPVAIRQRNADNEGDRRLLNNVRAASLRRVQAPGTNERRSSRSRRERSPEIRGHHRHGQRRRPEEEQFRRRAGSESPARHRQADRATERQPDVSMRTIEHQSSLRSLLSVSDIDVADLEDEIARRIIEDGLLDGIDLSNVGALQEQAIRERIDEVYLRRRGSRMASQGPPRRSSDAERTFRQTREGDRRQRAYSRSRSASIQDSESRPTRHPAQADDSMRRGEHRRRTSDSIPRPSVTFQPRAVGQRDLTDSTRDFTRSTTDLGQGTASLQSTQSRPANLVANWRRATDPSSGNDELSPDRSELGVTLPFRGNNVHESRPQVDRRNGSDGTGDDARTSAMTALIAGTAATAPTSDHPRRSQDGPSRPGSMLEPSSELTMRRSVREHPTVISSSSTGHARALPFPEPLVSCVHCGRSNIEYELHYNCAQCDGGEYNLCLSCYRAGRGCKHWYGFGSAARARYERQTPPGGYPPSHPLPHTLTGRRFLRPSHHISQPAPASNTNQRPRSMEDPVKRLQSGVFCAMCSSFANPCFWKCDICNDGEWGFCNKCVVTGRCCTHALLPLAYLPSSTTARLGAAARETLSFTAPTPAEATLLRAPWIVENGPLKPLSISTSCNICRLPVQPSSTRYHCLQCNDGNYDICSPCYLKLCNNGRISPEDGSKGWRRCLRGHRMIVVGFEDRDGGRKRVVVRDLVGGLALKEDIINSRSSNPQNASIAGNNWSWKEGSDGKRQSKIVSERVQPATGYGSSAVEVALPTVQHFPPDGGVGMRVFAQWGYYPKDGVADELMFPRAAEIREVEDINGDWYWGCYAGSKGLFPGPYVQVLDIIGA